MAVGNVEQLMNDILNIDTSIPELGVYKLFDDAHDLVRATKGSACFDIKAYIKPGLKIISYLKDNSTTVESLNREVFYVAPRSRALIPTGLIFDIPEGYSLRAHPRSGISLKEGITLINAEGIVDSDYVEMSYILLTNTTDVFFTLKDGDRVCQAELVENLKYNIKYISERPQQKTTRSGGFGHTGKQ